ncbi:MAG: YdeI/OmpD-associated family protein [Pseudomonadota bacterium]
MTDAQEIDRIEIASAEDLWAWLEANHAGPSVWLTTWKAAHRDKYVSRDEVLDALVAYGWIDGRRLKLDEDRTMQLIAPRQQTAWARSYKVRAERLIAEGRMQAPGMAAMEAGRASGQWNSSDPIDDLVVPEDLRAALDQAAASAWFDQAAPSYRRNVLRYLASAKRDATRAKRVAQLTSYSARGERLPNY